MNNYMNKLISLFLVAIIIDVYPPKHDIYVKQLTETTPNDESDRIPPSNQAVSKIKACKPIFVWFINHDSLTPSTLI